MNDRWYQRTVLKAGALLGLAGLIGVSAGAAPSIAPPLSDSAAPVWTAVAASGPVTSRAADAPETEWASVARGDLLPAKTLVRTGKRGRTTLSHPAGVILVDPASEIELPSEPTRAGETSVVQQSGTVLYKVDRRSRPHFAVVTPYLVAGVKGTTFLVTVDRSETRVTVSDGLVEINDSRTGELFEVGAGESFVHHGSEVRAELIDRDRGERRRALHARKDADQISRMEDRLTDLADVTGKAGDEPLLPRDMLKDESLIDAEWTDKMDPTDHAAGGEKGGEATKDLLEEIISEELEDGVLDPGGKGDGKEDDSGVGDANGGGIGKDLVEDDPTDGD